MQVFYLQNCSIHSFEIFARQAAQHHQFRRRKDSDYPRATRWTKCDQSLKARCILNNKFREHRLFIIVVTNRYANTSESRRDDPDNAEPVALKLKALKRSAAGEQVVEGFLRNGDTGELEMRHTREMERGDNINVGKTTVTEAGDT